MAPLSRGRSSGRCVPWNEGLFGPVPADSITLRRSPALPQAARQSAPGAHLEPQKASLQQPEEYIEQAHLFRALAERTSSALPVQELLQTVRQEVLVTTRLPHAIDFLLAELNHAGTMGTAMRRLGHYFAPFQTFLVEAAESDEGRFDMQRAMAILSREARFRAEQALPAGLFFFQFEAVARCRLSYDKGLEAMAGDPVYDADWSAWILAVRHRLGIVDLADLVYVYSEYARQRGHAEAPEGKDVAVLFGEREGRIALANRRREPAYFFSALQRQLGYPSIPEPPRPDAVTELIPKLTRQIEKLEVRMKLLEDEQREKGIDLSKFFGPGQPGG